MRKILVLLSVCTVLTACSLDSTYATDTEACVEDICESTHDELRDRHWLYRWYYFLTYPFLHAS